jgi:hypothetical protein
MRRRIPASQEGKVYIQLGAPFNVGAYIDRQSAIALSAGNSPSCLTHAYDIRVGKRGIETTKREAHDHQQSESTV